MPEASESDRFAALTRDGLRFGGDYNPEQWPAETWAEDVGLMREAGVNLVTVGVFSWSRYEPSPGVRDFGWLDQVLELLHDHEIDLTLATPTASPPPWLGLRYPETLPVTADGVRLAVGSRNHFSPASRVYRDHALLITEALVARYADHPALQVWHVGNEFGRACYGDESAAEFRAWLAKRYQDIAVLNEAWCTDVWSQRYADWSEILPPRRTVSMANPSQLLDWRCYCSDQLRSLFRDQRDLIRSYDSGRPVMTNFMGFHRDIDPWTWAADVDVVADDAYPDPADPQAPHRAALTQDLMRSLRGGAPWLLQESATGAVSWRPHNLPKSVEKPRLESIQAVARGADGICFFQWRASRGGPERFHSAMLPHAGAATRVHRGVCALGKELASLGRVARTRIDAEVGIVFDWPSWWAGSEAGLPTDRLDAYDQLAAWHRELWHRQIACELVPAGHDLSRYRVILVPQFYLLDKISADNLRAAVHGGAVAVVGPFTGVADANARVRTGRFPLLLRDLLGVSGEEWAPLPDHGVGLDLAADWPAPRVDHGARAGVMGELLEPSGANVLAIFAEGHLAGAPAVTRNAYGAGHAWYLATVPDSCILGDVLSAAVAAAGVTGALGDLDPMPGIEAVRRGDVIFVLNHTDQPATVPIAGSLQDLLTDRTVDGAMRIDPSDVVALVSRGDIASDWASRNGDRLA